MAIDISQRITDNFPRTEALLLAEDDIDYPTAKANAIASAKRSAYGTATVSSEADIPEIVAEWIGDQATVYLIPIAKEHYSLTRYRSKNNRQGENVSNYDLVRMLDSLKDELEAACASRWPKVEDLVGKSMLPRDLPEVSVAGMMLDPMARAQSRGLP
jgi:hypothetical protein